MEEEESNKHISLFVTRQTFWLVEEVIVNH